MGGQGERSNLVLAETRREEAIALFHVNQAGRTAIERVVALFVSVAAIAGSVGAAAGTADVVLPLPALLLLLLSYMCQQYGDLTVIGTARRHLEDLVNDELKGMGLIYETAIAEIRQTPPLSRSVTVLQVLLGLIVASATIGGLIVAVQDHPTLVLIAFLAATALAAASTIYSFVHMHKSSQVTRDRMARQGLEDKRLIWVSGDLYEKARDTAPGGELERQTFERLIRESLSGRGENRY